ncbi:hypothetical protein, partial [Burkholderia sp. TSV86]|uniref:hypothetical protein n=1 Tax=Burkholderia sp. TSV86 TaxID=1385594 RepID=UPI00075223F8
MSTIEVVRRPSIERAFREALSDPRNRGPVAAALGWDDSQVSRFLSGGMGLTIDKIDVAIMALDHRIVSRRYLEAHTTLSEVGLHCKCAREGFGECG